MIQFNSKDTRWSVLSNFHPVSLRIDGESYPSVEHYYQSQKFIPHDPMYAGIIQNAETPGKAKRLVRGECHVIRDDWETVTTELLTGFEAPVKELVMLKGLRYKFVLDMDCRAVLLATGFEDIVEHSPWGDAYWGDGGDGAGKNRMGELLMMVRDELYLRPECQPKPPFKAVRDGIPGLVAARNELHLADIIAIRSPHAWRQLLQDKLLEEAREVISAPGKDDKLAELGDLYEVIRSLAREFGFAEADVVAAADKKLAERGGFNDRVAFRLKPGITFALPQQ